MKKNNIILFLIFILLCVFCFGCNDAERDCITIDNIKLEINEQIELTIIESYNVISENEDIIKVDGNLLKAVSEGDTVVNIYDGEILLNSINVCVEKNKIKGIVEVLETTIYKGEKKKLINAKEEYEYISNDENIASVDNEGYVQGVNEGITKVQVKYNNELLIVIDINVVGVTKNEFTYELLDGGLEVVDLVINNNDKIVIPDEAEYEGKVYDVISVRLANNEVLDNKDIFIGKNIKTIKNVTNNINSIEVDESNEHFVSVDGALYSKDLKEILLYSKYKKDERIVINDNVSKICDSAFKGNIFIKEVIFNSNSVYLNKDAFKECINLENVSFSQNCFVSISESVFRDCYSLISFEASKIFDIRSYAFYNCYNLKKVSSKDSVITSLGDQVFKNCFNLSEFNVSNEPIKINYMVYSKINGLGYGIFENCHSLEKIDLTLFAGASRMMFLNCYSLKEVDLTNLKNIEEKSFENCLMLEIPKIDKETYIQTNAFVNCPILEIHAYNCNGEYSSSWEENICNNNIIYVTIK